MNFHSSPGGIDVLFVEFALSQLLEDGLNNSVFFIYSFGSANIYCNCMELC